jgi:type I restriction enzyme, R subunit
MAPTLNESIVEEATLIWLQQLGYSILNGSDIAPETPHAERQTYADTVLIDRLQTALERINPQIPRNTITEVCKTCTLTNSPNLFENNRRFHQLLTTGVDVEYPAADRTIYDITSNEIVNYPTLTLR